MHNDQTPIYLLFMPLFYVLFHLFTIILLMNHLSSNVYATILFLYKIKNDHFLWRYHAVAISFVHRTISRHAAHVAVSFVSRYHSVAILFGYHQYRYKLTAARLKKGTAQRFRLANSARIFISLSCNDITIYLIVC